MCAFIDINCVVVFCYRGWDLPDKFSDEGNEQQQAALAPVQTVAAVGSSPLVGAHLARVAAAWSAGSRHCAVQLLKVGLNEEECAEVTESLLALQQKHGSQ